MSEDCPEFGGTIGREGNEAVIRVPLDQVQAMRVALQPCCCSANKTSAGIEKRRSLIQGLGRVLFGARGNTVKIETEKIE